MKETLKMIIADLLIENGNLKILMKNKMEAGTLTESELNELLDRIAKTEETIEKLRKGLK